jgi:hypothetical protein
VGLMNQTPTKKLYGFDETSPIIKKIKKMWIFKMRIGKIAKMFAGFFETLSF